MLISASFVQLTRHAGNHLGGEVVQRANEAVDVTCELVEDHHRWNRGKQPQRSGQKHTLVYTVVLGLVLTAFFDLSRIAALGIIFYLIMDIAVHWGVLRHLRKEVGANPIVLVIAILLDAVVLAGFLWVKATTDPLVLIVATIVMAAILIAERLFLSRNGASSSNDNTHSH